jgi:hypothetical protein
MRFWGGIVAIAASFHILFPTSGWAQAQTQINFCARVDLALCDTNVTLPDGALIFGTVTYPGLTPVLLDGIFAGYTNGDAEVTININGTVTNYQGVEVCASIMDIENSPYWMPANRLQVRFGPEFWNGINIYIEPTFTFAALVDVNDPAWWSRRYDYPGDTTVTIGGIIADLSVYGVAPNLWMQTTNGCVQVCYPTNAFGYCLQYSTTLGRNCVWQTVTNAVTTNGCFCSAAVSNFPAPVFFRLGTRN